MNTIFSHKKIFVTIGYSSIYFILLASFIFFNSCKKYPIGPQTKGEDKIDSTAGNGVFIVCEGNFNWGNGTLSFYNFSTKTVSNNIFNSVNSKPLGDIPQSLTIKDTIGFIVINNSGKIEVINTRTFKSISTIQDINSPRYLLVINNEKAYVSSLYANLIYIINPKTYQLSGTISTGGSTEQMILYKDFVYAANWSNGNKLFVINSLTNEIHSAIITGKEPNSMVLDRNNKIWILCSGGFMHDEPAQLIKLNPENNTIEKNIVFSQNDAYPTKLCINKTNDTLFFLNNGIFKMSIYDETIPQNELISKQNRNLYGLTIDKQASEIYVSNAVDFVQQGWIYRYTFSGIAIDSFKVEINPGEFCFN